MTSEISWQQIIFHTSKQFSDDIEFFLEESGALSITWNDAGDTPVLEPLPGETPLWDELVATVLFDTNKNLTLIKQQLSYKKDMWEISKLQVEKVEDKDWVRVWMKDFHPMKFGDNLWIYPSNYDIPDDDSVKIHLDPGLAFGTGTHPTTALCLEWLDQNPPHNLQMVDYGCGSGILAVAAAKLGAQHIVATDIDPQGLTATKENMLRNTISDDKISCYLPDACPQNPVDLVMANILFGPLLELFPRIASLTKSNGTLVVSGLLKEQTDQLIELYSSKFKNFNVQVQGDWARVSAIKT